jgi:hypothetical protein
MQTLIPSTTFADPVTAEKIPYVQFLQQTTVRTAFALFYTAV